MLAGTIAALASPPGGGARALIRVSGPETRTIVAALWRGAPLQLGARTLARGRFDDGRGTQPLLLLWMPGPRSFTREDVAEFHLPGSPPLIAAALQRILALGARAAQPGEFTRRAFHSGRIDLSQAEGVLELVTAVHESERAAALELVTGGLARRVEGLRSELVELLARSEAGLDFEAADTGHVALEELEAGGAHLVGRIDEALAFERARAARGSEARVVLAGAPNAGKSTLFNALLAREEALVADEAGTTRDVLRGRFVLGAQALLLVDSAGLDGGARGLERQAQEHTHRALGGADAILWVVDASRVDASALRLAAQTLPEAAPRLLVWNQVDRASAPAAPPPELARAANAWVATSGRSGRGLDELRAALAALLGRPGEARPLLELSARHAAALRAARERVARGLAAARAVGALELLAEDLRAALAALDEISGATTSEDVLDRIFARFCIGK